MKYFIALCSLVAKFSQYLYDQIFGIVKNISEPAFLLSIDKTPLLLINKNGSIIKTEAQKKREIEAVMFSFDQIANKKYLFSVLNRDKDSQITEKDLEKYKITAKNLLKKGYWVKFSDNLTKEIKENLTKDEEETIRFLLNKS